MVGFWTLEGRCWYKFSMKSIPRSTAAIVILGFLLPGALFAVGSSTSGRSGFDIGTYLLASTELNENRSSMFTVGKGTSDICVLDESSQGTDGGNGSQFPARLEKEYESWGEVKRPGVVMPVTTLFNAHTRESLPVFDTPRVKPFLLQHFFRCRGFGETVEMAPELLDAILSAARHFESRRTTIISGYRSPKFNDTLAKKGRRVASESRHMKGQAVDFRLDTAPADQLGPWLRSHFSGGVGTYRADNFVHIDIGPERSWEGH
jgi:hypothetical protein